MERYYYLRGRRLTAEDTAGDTIVLANWYPELGVDTPLGHTPSAERALQDLVPPSQGAARAFSRALEAFQRARWMFHTPQDVGLLPPSAPLQERGDVVLLKDFDMLAVVTNRLTVQLRPDLSEAQAREVLKDSGLYDAVRRMFLPNLFHVRAGRRDEGGKWRDALEASEVLQNDPDFVFAEPLFIHHLPQQFRPSDPEYPHQWHLDNPGQVGGYPSLKGADISAEQAWDKTKGAGITVAIIDIGFQTDHPDFSKDGASCVSNLSGSFSSDGTFNLINHDLPNGGLNDSNHGTFCAGIVGARHSNCLNGSGVAPECDLLLIDHGWPWTDITDQGRLTSAVSYAGDHADILVCSLGESGVAFPINSELSGVLHTSAALGRNGLGMCIFWSTSNYEEPVSCNEVNAHPDVIAIASSDRHDLRAPGSYGDSIELTAPGEDVNSTQSGSGYGLGLGTSYAAPCAAGCAALALSMCPEMTAPTLRQIMRDTADKIGEFDNTGAYLPGVYYMGHNYKYGYGRVNAYQAVLKAEELKETNESTAIMAAAFRSSWKLMTKLQLILAIIAVFFVGASLTSTLVAIWIGSPRVGDFLALTDLLLSWEVVAGGFVFGGAQWMIRAYRGR